MSRTIHISDTSLCMWGTNAHDDETYAAMRDTLRANGFSFHQDPDIKKNYPIIAKSHHHGQRGILEFNSEIFPAGMKFEFYQNQVFENKHGGKYDFDKRKKMPYLTGKLFELISRKLIDTAEAHGFTFTPPEPLYGMEAALSRQQDWVESHGGFKPEDQPDYNVRDADGVRLRNGDTRYFYNYDRRLRRGTVIYSANNIWLAVTTPDAWPAQMACFELFSYCPGKHPVRKPVDAKQARQAALERAVKAQNYLRAHAIHEAIQKAEAV